MSQIMSQTMSRQCPILDILIVNVSAMSPQCRHLRLLLSKLLTMQLMSQIETLILKKTSSVGMLNSLLNDGC